MTHRVHHRASRRRPSALVLALCTGLALASTDAAHAIDYVVEIVLFETLDEHAVGDDELLFPKVTSAIGLASEQAAAAGFRIVEDGTELDDAAARIAGSGRYRLLRHFAWRQPGLDEREARAIRVNLGEAFELYLPDDLSPYEHFIPASAEPGPEHSREVRSTTVNGTLKVRLGRFLHLEALLVYTDRGRGRSHRLFESRKMRSTELHYIDNPRFGLLARILPIEDEPTEDEN